MNSHSNQPSQWTLKSSDGWRPLRRLGRSRRPLLIATLVLVLLIYWQPHRAHTVVDQNVIPGDTANHVSSRDSRAAHERLHQIVKDHQAKLDESLAQTTVKQVINVKQANDDDGNVEPAKHEIQEEHVNIIQEVKDEKSGILQEHTRDGEHEAPKPKKASQKDEDGDDIQDTLKDLPKGPVAVQPDLDPEHQKAPLITSPDLPTREKIIESESDDHLSLEEKGATLPEIIHFSFEDAVVDMKLQGWEDDWIAKGSYDNKKWGSLQEPKVDFVYLWVNGSEQAFQDTKRPYEENSILNDEDGIWINSHGVNRYRDWDELKYSLRSVENYASSFRNKIQIIVNSVQGTKAGKQTPTWLNNAPSTREIVQVLAQEDFFDDEKHVCLPTFNSLTIENQLFNTPSDSDYLYALSDDMLLGKQHSASDIVSPLFGPVMGFKTNAYNTINPPTDADAARFGEKPYLIYTSWLLNRRFGNRKRKGQGHFGHSLSRSLMREAIGSFPGPELESACKRFRGEPGFQLYSWFASFHYLIERHRETMLWSYIMHRSDVDGDGFLSWDERQTLMKSLEIGMVNEGKISFRKRNFYHVPQLLQKAGLEAPQVNTDIQWTSLDGPVSIMNLDCSEFDVNECLAPGFSISKTDLYSKNPVFSTAVIFDRVARQKPQCGDCLIKIMLNQAPHGQEPILPDATTQPEARDIVIKALMRYKYTISDPDALFVMVTDAEQVDNMLTNRYVRGKKQLAGQLCLNDDVTTEDEQELKDVKQAMTELYQGLFPKKSSFEI